MRFAETYLRPLLAEDKPVRRSNRVLPEPINRAAARRNAAAAMLAEDEPITTAPRSSLRHNGPGTQVPTSVAVAAAAASEDGAAQGSNPGGRDVVRQWVSEFANDARPATTGGGTVRASSEGEIQILTGMFPDIDREVVLGVLQRR